MNRTKILFWNLQGNKTTSRSILEKARDYDILALQEPWTQEHGGVYCPNSCAFIPIQKVISKDYPPRAVILVNKKL
jgi:hypothetical protein